MKIIKYIAVSVLLTVAITAGVFLYKWMGRETISFEIPRITSDLKVEKIHLSKAMEGKKEWELTAKTAEYFKEKGITYLELPEVVFWGKGRRIELRGERGEVFNDAGDVNIYGDVFITTSDGYTFESDSLSYNSEKRVVTTESKIALNGNRINVTGQGMLVDIEKDRIIIKRDVRARLEGGIE